MNTVTYTIAGRTYKAVKVATCSGRNYTNFQSPKNQPVKTKRNEKLYA